MHALLVRRAFFVVSVSFLAACSGHESHQTPYLDPEPVAQTRDAITASTVISRAMEWVNAKLQYCQSPNHQHDYDTACAPTCNRTDNPQWDPYRSDCSGLVSWAWGLPPPGRITSQFAPYDTQVSHVIKPSDLAPGDALNSTPDEHIILFKAWVTKDKEATFIEEPGCSTNPDYAHEFNSSVTIHSDGTVHVAYTGMTFWPIRFDSITGQDGPAWAASFVKQSWPYASAAPIQLTVGETKKGSIDLKNTGSKTWPKGVVKLAPIPRDKASNLQASSWLSKTRVSAVTTDVKPGEVGHFEWDLEGNEVGHFKPYFGLVAEGFAWFADSGGPADDVIQVNVEVKAAPPPSGMGGASGSGGKGEKGGEAGAPAEGGNGGAAPAKGGNGGEAGAGEAGKAGATSGGKGGAGGESAAGEGGGGTSASTGAPSEAGAGGEAGASSAGGDSGSPVDLAGTGEQGGCSVSEGGSRDASSAALLAIAAAVVVTRRKRAAQTLR